MTTRTLSLCKSGHKYVFRYSPGCEEGILEEITRLADDAASGLDWLDAAGLSFQVACQAAGDAADATHESLQ